MGGVLSALVDTGEGLEKLVAELREASDIALDTEGNSFHAYRDQVCLIQLAVGLRDPRIFLLDPLAVDPRALTEIFADPKHRLVVHGGDFDVRSLRRDFGFTFGRMFDTMMAAQTLRLPELGLVALFKQELGVTIEKGEQPHPATGGGDRCDPSNWRMRARMFGICCRWWRSSRPSWRRPESWRRRSSSSKSSGISSRARSPSMAGDFEG